MNFQILSSHSTDKQLKCSLCKNLLSHFPVFSNCENENICGRCTLPQETPYFRNHLYEYVADFLTFPCRYQNQGCGEDFLARDIPQHEKTCPYRKIKCPMVDACQCDWEGSRLCLLQHCRDNHIDLFIECKGFEIEVTQSNNKKYLLEKNDQLFYFETKFDLTTKYFECAFYHLEDETDDVEYPWQIALKSGDRFISVLAITSKFTEKRFTDISLELLKSRKENFPSQVVGSISFGETSAESRLKTSEDLKDLKCSDCSEPVTPPLHQCFSKYAILCKKCLKKHLPSCMTCTQLLHVVHNSESLKGNDYGDEIANLLDHSCKYKEKGCSVVANGNKAERHEEVCPFKEVKCPRYHLCSWEGSLQILVSHIDKDHHDRKVKCNSALQIPILRKNNRSNYHSNNFIEYMDTFFNLEINVRNNCLNWIVQAIDKCKENYYYEIEILNRNSGNNTRKFQVGAPCSSIVQEDETNDDNKKYTCRMYLDQIEEQLNEKLTFKINIFEKEKKM